MTSGFLNTVEPKPSTTMQNVSSAADAGSQIAMTIASIVDQGKRRKMEQSLSLLSNAQQQQLNQRLSEIKDKNEKIRILSESITKYLTDNATSSIRKDAILLVTAGVIVVALLAGVVFVSIKK